MRRIGVIGAGSWGTALAQLYALKGLEVTLWARRPALVETLRRRRENPRLPGIALAPALEITHERAALSGCEAVLVIVPAQAMRETLTGFAPHLTPAAPVLIGSKGVERGTLALMTDIAGAVLPGRPAGVLTGPSFAEDVARGLPTAVTLAIADRALGQGLQDTLSTPGFRAYRSDDTVGAQIGGALKNVLAIACGAAGGMGLGASARAALIARGFAEMLRLAGAMGGRAETLHGLSGLGDLTLTCNSTQSRNFSLGLGLGRGEGVARGADAPVYEGRETAEAAAALMTRHGVKAPITHAVAAIVRGEQTVDQAVRALLDRPVGDETAG